jgi:DNA-binding NarL/FixJ family response regulator
VLSFLTPRTDADRKVFDALSSRELQVLALMADGLSNSRIGERLHIGDKTVRNHASNLPAPPVRVVQE